MAGIRISILMMLFSWFDVSTCTCTNLNLDVDVTGEGTDCVYIFTRLKNVDGTCPSLHDAAEDLATDMDYHLIAYYPLDINSVDHSGNSHHGQDSSGVQYNTDAVCGHGSGTFDGQSRIVIDSFNNFVWGTTFSVSVWFKRTGQFGNYQGIVNNGYYNTGSWEIRMGNEYSGTMIGGGVVTGNSDTTWDYVGLIASSNEWHHVVMSYDCGSLKYYLDGVAQDGDNDCCSGPILTRNNPVTIGQAGAGKTNEYFYGYIDEVKLFKKCLTAADVQTLFTTPCVE